MTDVYIHMAEGVVDLEYPIPDPEPIARLLHGLREDERIDTLHVDNGNHYHAENHPGNYENISGDTIGWNSSLIWS